MDADLAKFEIRKVVENVADLVARIAQAKKLEMLCYIEPDVPTHLWGDPDNLRRAIANLAGNAVKFTVEGNITLSARLQDPQDAGLIRFDVADTGPGIAENQRHFLFERPGLATLSGLVEALGGNLGYLSEEGRGSTFWFTASMAPQSEVKPRPLSLEGKRVLIVDDSAASRALLLRFLNGWQCRPDEASGAAEAMDRLRAPESAPYDVALIDQEMPFCRGDRLARIMRADQSLPNMPLVLMTDLWQGADPSYWQSSGFAGCVTKPVKQAELGACLASILANPATFNRQDLIARVMGNESVARREVRCFVSGMPTQLAALSMAIDAADTERTHALAHSIKGAAANVSGASLARVASVLEESARQGDMSKAKEVFAELSVEFEQANTEFTDFLAPASTRPSR